MYEIREAQWLDLAPDFGSRHKIWSQLSVSLMPLLTINSRLTQQHVDAYVFKSAQLKSLYVLEPGRV